MPTQDKQSVEFDIFTSGLADSRYLGVLGSFAKAVGINYRSEPGLIRAQQKLKKDSGATVVDLIRASVHTSSGHGYLLANDPGGRGTLGRIRILHVF